MRRSIVFLNAAVAVVLAGTARADFGLRGTEHLNVATGHTTGVLWDSSTADVLAGGYIGTAYVNDEALLRVMRLDGGTTVGTGRVYNTGRIAISSGRVNDLYAYETSNVNVSGGSVGGLYAYNDSSVNISGASLDSLTAYGSSSVNVSGGTFNTLYAEHTSSVHVSGGTISGYLSARDTSSVALHGYDFRTTGGLTLANDEVLGTGVLTGKWFDGTSWIIPITTNASAATIRAAMLAPSVASFAGDPMLVHDIDFGTVNPGDSVPGEPFAIWNLADPKWSMNLDLLSIVGSGDTGPLTASLSPFTDLAAGQSHSFTAWMCPSEPGDFAASYALNFSDRLGSGSCQTITLNLRGSVVPEPSTLILLLLATGTLGLTVGWWRRRRR
ncbi:MAG TPA: PEP-CTERM sorting domain-containing protein [Thermoguttaceae bacterium]|nr:PEP-CTERM sorting domain-containing protein [Thermoguttaceae bacterium]